MGIRGKSSAAPARGRGIARALGHALLAVPLLGTATAAAADPLVISNVGAPVQSGSGQGKRAIWTNAGTVGGQPVDLVATLATATLNHNFTSSGNRPSITSVGQDDIWVEWRIFAAGTYNIGTNSGGVPVAADVHVQLNDIDGPNNERAYVPVCDGSVAWVRIDRNATTGRSFGTVAGVPEILSLIGDRNYNSEPESGLEVLYPNTSTFRFGRTASNNYFIRVDNPTYDDADTIDYQCADLTTPVASDDAAESAAGVPAVVAILLNDSIVADNPSGQPSEFGLQSVTLVAPGGATGVLTDADGDVYRFAVPGQGTWHYDQTDGNLTFTPLAGFVGTVTPITYTFDNALGETSNPATVSVEYPAIGIVKSAVLADQLRADGRAQIGERIDYSYQVSVLGGVAIEGVAIAETGFTGAGAAPVPAYQGGDANANGRIDPGETWVYTAFYTIVAADIAAGSVSNQATASGVSVGGIPVSDLSDSTNAGDGDGTGTPGPGAGNDDTTVSVLAPATIDAADDTPPAVTGIAATPNLADVLANDTLSGAAAGIADVALTIVAPAGHAGVTLDVATGIVSVAAATPAGSYAIRYRICELLNPANCDEATVTVTVGAAAIDAADDAPPAVSGIAATPNLADVLANDTLNGVAVAIGDIALTVVTPAGHAGVTLDPATGTVSVAAATPAGGYATRYRICELLNPANCDEATVTVTVGAAAIDAADDAPPAVSGIAATPNLVNVLVNDTLNGAAVAIGDIALTVVTPAGHAGVTLDVATGIVSVAAATPAGSYAIRYRICELLNPANCDEATVTVTVGAAQITAGDDAPQPVTGATGDPILVNVLGNDSLNAAPAAIADLTMSVMTPASHAGVALDPATGLVSVEPATPAGAYTIVYRICELLNPGNCDEATVTVAVAAAAIAAADDTLAAPVDTAHALPAVLNVLANDTLAGGPAGIGNVNVAASSPLPAGFTLTMQGAVDIAQGTASGDYVFGYRVCEILNPANCDTATVSIMVRKSVPAISGTVFFDANGNGVFDAGEQRLPGYRVELRRAGTLVRDVVSAADGSYRIYDFEPGAGYEVVFVDPASGMAVGRIADLAFAVDQVMSGQNQPIDPSGVVYNVVTGAPLAGVRLDLATAGGTPLPAICVLAGQQSQVTGADGRYRFDVVAGAHALCPAAETEYRIAITGYPGGVEPAVSVIAPPMPGALDATSCPIDAVPGGACQVSASADAPPAGTSAPYYLAFLLAPGDPHVVNNHIPLDPLPAIPASGLSVTKRAGVAVARRDEVVSYVIVAANDNAAAAGPLDVTDSLPAGFAFVPGSARVDGAEAVPSVAGRRLTFAGLRLPARGSVEIRLSARIGADVVPGDHANEAWITDPASGRPLTPAARAVVRVVAEHVFDCADVTGKVFDDRNRDGWQDEGERGLPAVRIATVNGILVTTDRHGRFSVPCAALPDQTIGSNFILKLDPRSLPHGFGVTTENPRVVRLTAGKAAVVNFGATAGRVVDIQITGRAFRRGSAEPGAELVQGIGRLAGLEAKGSAALSVTYRAGGDPEPLRRARVAAMRQLLGQVWRDGRKPLPFEIRVVEVDR